MSAATESQIGRRRAAAKAKNSAIYLNRRPEIVRAAAELFKRQGVARTTLAEIAAAAGAAQASIYYYFANKDEVFDAVIDEGVSRTLGIIEDAAALEADALAKIRFLVVELMVSFEEHYPYTYVYLQDHLDHAGPKRGEWAARMREINQRGEAAVEGIIKQGIDEGTIEPLAAPRVLSFGVFGMVCWTNRWFTPGSSPASGREIGEAYAEVLVRGLARR